MIAYLGIDPGATGALALYGVDTAEVWDFNPTSNIESLRTLTSEYTIRMAILEHVGAMPGQGGVSMFSFGANFGWWQGVLETLGIPYQLVRPQKWQKALGVPKKSSKTDKPSLAIARRRFPLLDLHRQKDHGRADALLMAVYAATLAV
jgi:crossover junction endodeoxyribonuclease RuvC